MVAYPTGCATIIALRRVDNHGCATIIALLTRRVDNHGCAKRNNYCALRNHGWYVLPFSKDNAQQLLRFVLIV